MPDSTSPKINGYVLDTNVLSLFAKESYLNLLDIASVSLYITPAIQQELEAGSQRGVGYLDDALALINLGKLQVLVPTQNDIHFMQTMPRKLAQGEREAIAICKRLDLILISHDRKALNYCDSTGINCIPLTDLLAEFQHMGVITASEVVQILP